jgi:DNA-binding PadR family transcriptional regulator
MTPVPGVTPEAALLRVLIAGESEAPEIIRKIRDWTDGQIDLDERQLIAAIRDLETTGLVERHAGATDKRTGQPRLMYALTPSGHSSAVQILAASLTRKS